MALVYEKRCVFFHINKNNSGECAACKLTCLLCEFKIKKIKGLDIKDHLSLVFARNNYNLSFLFASVAFAVSIVTLLFEIFKYIFF
jgi:hypothetical protein